MGSRGDERTERLRRALDGPRRAGHEGIDGIDLTPKSAHEALTRQMVTDLATDVGEVKTRMNQLIGAVVIAILADIAMRLAGVG
jgi:hypothetical protein